MVNLYPISTEHFIQIVNICANKNFHWYFSLYRTNLYEMATLFTTHLNPYPFLCMCQKKVSFVHHLLLLLRHSRKIWHNYFNKNKRHINTIIQTHTVSSTESVVSYIITMYEKKMICSFFSFESYRNDGTIVRVDTRFFVRKKARAQTFNQYSLDEWRHIYSVHLSWGYFSTKMFSRTFCALIV